MVLRMSLNLIVMRVRVAPVAPNCGLECKETSGKFFKLVLDGSSPSEATSFYGGIIQLVRTRPVKPLITQFDSAISPQFVALWCKRLSCLTLDQKVWVQFPVALPKF